MESNTAPHRDHHAKPDPAATPSGPTSEQRQTDEDEFLMPGPTSTSNEGTARWAISWLVFSVVLMLFMLLISVICFGFARLAGLA